ncbi:hypothetical protein ARHIZOSPH14_28540 [Agromyces rhizosphaerae]|uniref:Uncharacterized protein n=1 Tax=Agromyces rhizosphaerae TaxID=88374 RepID=A0A9W6D0K2_9MICO|nr:hypothetical protein ARHIZOSPH14_28540 [Agromyces rhizosphaerae]
MRPLQHDQEVGDEDQRQDDEGSDLEPDGQGEFHGRPFGELGSAERRTSLPHRTVFHARSTVDGARTDEAWPGAQAPRGILPFVLASLIHDGPGSAPGTTNAPGPHGEPRAFLVL